MGIIRAQSRAKWLNSNTANIRKCLSAKLISRFIEIKSFRMSSQGNEFPGRKINFMAQERCWSRFKSARDIIGDKHKWSSRCDDGDDCDNFWWRWQFCTFAALAMKPLATSPSSGNPLRGNVLGHHRHRHHHHHRYHHHHHLDEMWTKVYKNVKEYWRWWQRNESMMTAPDWG